MVFGMEGRTVHRHRIIQTEWVFAANTQHAIANAGNGKPRQQGRSQTHSTSNSTHRTRKIVQAKFYEHANDSNTKSPRALNHARKIFISQKEMS